MGLLQTSSSESGGGPCIAGGGPAVLEVEHEVKVEHMKRPCQRPGTDWQRKAQPEAWNGLAAETGAQYGTLCGNCHQLWEYRRPLPRTPKVVAHLAVAVPVTRWSSCTPGFLIQRTSMPRGLASSHRSVRSLGRPRTCSGVL